MKNKKYRRKKQQYLYLGHGMLTDTNEEQEIQKKGTKVPLLRSCNVDLNEEQKIQRGTNFKVHLRLYNVDLHFSLMLFKNPLMMSKLKYITNPEI